MYIQELEIWRGRQGLMMMSWGRKPGLERTRFAVCVLSHFQPVRFISQCLVSAAVVGSLVGFPPECFRLKSETEQPRLPGS